MKISIIVKKFILILLFTNSIIPFNASAILGHQKVKIGPLKICHDHPCGEHKDLTKDAIRIALNPIGYGSEKLCRIGMKKIIKNPEKRRRTEEMLYLMLDPIGKSSEQIYDYSNISCPGPYESENDLWTRLTCKKNCAVATSQIAESVGEQTHAWSCGANSGARVINYYPGRNVSYQELAENLPCLGFFGLQLGPYPQILTYYLNQFKPRFNYIEFSSIKTLQLLTSKGYPLIALVTPIGEINHNILHYVVVTRFIKSDNGLYVEVVDTNCDIREYPIDQFEFMFNLGNMDQNLYKQLPLKRRSIIYHL